MPKRISSLLQRPEMQFQWNSVPKNTAVGHPPLWQSSLLRVVQTLSARWRKVQKKQQALPVCCNSRESFSCRRKHTWQFWGARESFRFHVSACGRFRAIWLPPVKTTVDYTRTSCFNLNLSVNYLCVSVMFNMIAAFNFAPRVTVKGYVLKHGLEVRLKERF